MAPIPKPTALKLLEGNPGKRPMNPNEPKPMAGVPSCPSHLDRLAKAEWRRIVPELQQLGLLTRVDRAALAAYCACWSRWVTAEREISKHGLTVVTPNGYPVQSPHVNISNKALAQLKAFVQEFGLSPASRTRVSAVPQVDADDDFFSVR